MSSINSPLKEILTALPNKTVLHFLPGSLILQQGDECNQMFYILKGSVRTILLNQQSDEVLVSLHNMDEFICEASYAKYGRSMLSLYAIEETDLLPITSQEFSDLLTRYPEFSATVMANMAQKLDFVVNGLDRYTSSSISERVRNTLLLFVRKYGVQTPDGLKIDHRFTDAELGIYVGAKRESVNRALKKLRDEKILFKKGGFLYVLDLDRLQNSID